MLLCVSMSYCQHLIRMALRILRCLWLLRSLLLVRLSEAVGQGKPTLYCVALVTPGGYEPHLLAGQYALKAGIFECDDFALVSNVSARRLFAGHDSLLEEISSKVYQIDTTLFAPMLRGPPGFDPSSPKQLGNKGEKHLANTPIFLHFWKKLAEAGVYKKYNYTVKVDVDTVLLPARLSGLLAGRDEGARYFLNTAKDMYGNFLHGPVEILSTAALSIFRNNSKECEKKISKLAYGEDFWMNNCLKHLKVHAVAGLPLLYDMYSYGAYAQKTCGWLIPEKTTGHTAMTFAAYHPYKTFWEWMQCRMQTGEAPGYPMELQKLAASKADTPIAFEFKYTRPGILGVLKDSRATVPVAVLLVALCAAIVMSSAWAANIRRQCCGQKLYIEANTVTAVTEEQSFLNEEPNSPEIEKFFPRAFQN